jgi:hypothetical protein
MNIFDLSPSVLVSIVFDWLELKQTTCLDTSFCSSSYRNMFLKLLHYKQSVFEDVFISNQMLAAFNWIILKGISLQAIAIRTERNERIDLKIIQDSSFDFTKLQEISFENFRVSTKQVYNQLCSIINCSFNLKVLALINLNGTKEFFANSINVNVIENITKLFLVSDCKSQKKSLTFGCATFHFISENCKSLICFKMSFEGPINANNFPRIHKEDFIKLSHKNNQLEQLVLDCTLDVSGNLLNDFYIHCPQLKEFSVQMGNSTSTNDYKMILSNGSDKFQMIQTYSFYFDKFYTNTERFTLCMNQSESFAKFKVSDDFFGSLFLEHVTHVAFKECLISQLSIDKFCTAYKSTLLCFSYVHNSYELSHIQLHSILKNFTHMERILVEPFNFSSSEIRSIFTSSQPKSLKCITFYECSAMTINDVLVIITETMCLEELALTLTNGKISKHDVKKLLSANKEWLRNFPRMSFD